MKFKELISFWKFWKESSNEVNESLLICSDSFDTFKKDIYKGHHKFFRDFKIKFFKDSKKLRKEIIDCKDNDLQLILITYFQKQLEYFNSNPYGPYASKIESDKFDKFIADNYPYQEKVEQIKANYLSTANKDEKFLAQGVSKFIDVMDKQTNQPSPFSNNKPRIK